MNDIANEIRTYETKSKFINEKLSKIKGFVELISKSKAKIASLIDLNRKTLNKPIELQNQIDDIAEILPEQIKSLNLNQTTTPFSPNQSISSLSTSLSFSSSIATTPTVLNTSLLDEYFSHDFDLFKAKLKPNQIKVFNISDTQSAKNLEPLINMLNYNESKSKHCLYEELVRILSVIDSQNSLIANDDIDTTQLLKVTTNLENVLEKCKQHDKVCVEKHGDLINNCIDKCVKWKESLNRVS